MGTLARDGLYIYDTLLLLYLRCSLASKTNLKNTEVLLGKNSLLMNYLINPLQPGVAFLYLLKTSENRKIF